MVDTNCKGEPKVTVRLSYPEEEIIKYCAALRDVGDDTIPNVHWVRLVDMLATAMGVSDVQIECACCRYWKYAGSVSGENHGRGRCTRISYSRSEEEGMYDLLMYTGRWDDTETGYGRVQGIQRTVDVFTVGNFCCSHFWPRKEEGH